MTGKPVVFIADPVDEDGNVIGTASMTLRSSITGAIDVVKIPHDEIVLDDNASTSRCPSPTMPERALPSQSERQSVPDPREGMLVYDPNFPQDRWRIKGVTGLGIIEAKRVNPADGARTNWSPDSWERAWTKGYLLEARA